MCGSMNFNSHNQNCSQCAEHPCRPKHPLVLPLCTQSCSCPTLRSLRCPPSQNLVFSRTSYRGCLFLSLMPLTFIQVVCLLLVAGYESDSQSTFAPSPGEFYLLLCMSCVARTGVRVSVSFIFLTFQVLCKQ